MEKMKKVPKRKWLEALRSGEYIQGKQQLVQTPSDYCWEEHPRKTRKTEEEEYRFCCLGVLENLYCESKGIEFPERNWSMGSHTDEVAKWAGLANDSCEVHHSWKIMKNKVAMKSGGHYVTYGAYNYLSSMNDKGKSFKQIANWIEKNL